VPAFINLGFYKGNQVNTGGSVSFGLNIVQNRNSTKQNFTAQSIGDGFKQLNTIHYLNMDSDLIDTPSFDAMDIAGPQI
jgi:hypothetical protein